MPKYKINLEDFIKNSFSILNPSTKFLPNWHIDLIAYKLNEVAKGNIKRLIINVPPRSLKSTCVSVAWPAWLLGHDPSRRIMASSYSQILSLKHSLDCKRLITSKWYQQLFPDVKICSDHNRVNKFITTGSGYRFATSVLGTATGEGGNYLIVDDPHNAIQAASPILRKKGVEWFEQTFVSRLDDKKNGAIVIVMQRLHEDDLTGHLIKKKNHFWHVLTLPALANGETIYKFNNRTIIRQDKEPLHAKREDIKEIEQTRIELGDYAFNAQYLQNPITKLGKCIKYEWLKKYDNAPKEFIRLVQSWDIACKIGEKNDFSVCTTWGETLNQYYLLDVVRERLDYPDLKKIILSKASNWKPGAILIEDKASGIAMIQDLTRQSDLTILPIKVSINKLNRFAAISAMFESGQVILPNSAPWLVDYENELLNFPGSTHDDQADSTSQFLNYIRERKIKDANISSI
jgi:predicted phage terminase large subunit-like protein